MKVKLILLIIIASDIKNIRLEFDWRSFRMDVRCFQSFLLCKVLLHTLQIPDLWKFTNYNPSKQKKLRAPVSFVSFCIVLKIHPSTFAVGFHHASSPSHSRASYVKDPLFSNSKQELIYVHIFIKYTPETVIHPTFICVWKTNKLYISFVFVYSLYKIQY